MKKKLWRIVFAVLFLLPVCAKAIPIDVNIYSDTTISSGNYGTVNIYDTVPNQTTVDMIGGKTFYCNAYDSAVFNWDGGQISCISSHNSSTINIDTPMSPTMYLYDQSKVYLNNGGPGASSILIYDDAQLYVYGNSLELIMPTSQGTSGGVSGYWENGQSFFIGFRNAGDFDPLTQVFLHEIPEPSTISILGLLALFVKKRGYSIYPKG